MTPTDPTIKDLIVLVADKSQEMAIGALLENRRRSLGIRQITYDIDRHPEHDPGIYRRGASYLSTFAKQYGRALVVLDAHWEGTPGAEKIQKKITKELAYLGWEGRNKVIVIIPELEVWVWSSSPCVYEALHSSPEQVKEIANVRQWWQKQDTKPSEPKLLLEEILRRSSMSKSSSFFAKLARKVGLDRCNDASFLALKDILRGWFPAEEQS